MPKRCPASAEAPSLSAAPRSRLREVPCPRSPGVTARAWWRSGRWQAAGRQSVQIGEAPAQQGVATLARSTHAPLRADASVQRQWRVTASRWRGGAVRRGTARCGAVLTRCGAVRRGAARRGAVLCGAVLTRCGGAPALGSSTARPTRARAAVRTQSGAATWRSAPSRGRPGCGWLRLTVGGRLPLQRPWLRAGPGEVR